MRYRVLKIVNQPNEMSTTRAHLVQRVGLKGTMGPRASLLPPSQWPNQYLRNLTSDASEASRRNNRINISPGKSKSENKPLRYMKEGSYRCVLGPNSQGHPAILFLLGKKTPICPMNYCQILFIGFFFFFLAGVLKLMKSENIFGSNTHYKIWIFRKFCFNY